MQAWVVKHFIPIVCCIALAAVVKAQTDDPPSPTPVSFTASPRQVQWRLGFDLGNATILEVPELNPQNDFESAVQEAERILPHPMLRFGLALLPFSKITIRTPQLLNPRQWTIVDLQGKTRQKTFEGIGVFMGTRMVSEEGGYHLVSIASMPSNPFVGLRREPSPEGLVFGLAGPVKSKVEPGTRLSETKWENLLPVEEPASLPAGYEVAKQYLDNDTDGQQRFVYGTSMEALVEKRVRKVWLLNYSHPDTTIGTHPWGIFLEGAGGLQPLYIFKPAKTANEYVGYFTAALDLNQDGSDELVIEASYRTGTAYKVISTVGSKYQEIYTSYYRGGSRH